MDAAATGRSAPSPREAGSAPPPPPCPAVRPEAVTAVREGALHVPGARGPQLALLRGHAGAAGQTATALSLVSKYQAASSRWEPSTAGLRVIHFKIRLSFLEALQGHFWLLSSTKTSPQNAAFNT